ncbi:LIC12231 family lipoprotein [Leptospira koniambonensis]|uniref:LIC12231 family lipoprotein n=1 Tax=Leptospira koniambonensis TaxID=2484950 RepID=UPI003EB86648
MREFIFIQTILLFLSNCIISYTDFPKKEKPNNGMIYFSVEDPKDWNPHERRKEFLKRGWKELELDRSPQKEKDRIHFLISRFPGLSRSESDVRRALAEKGWKEIENYPPEKGYYIDMKSSQKDPSLTAMIFLYLSYASFTILPSYSGKDGANITFTVYKDNSVLKTFEYEITRKAFVWILTLPVLWLNYMYPTEAEAYQAVIDQFESDLYSSKL